MLESDDFKRLYEKEQERLAKLWDAYELQEKEVQQNREKIEKTSEILADKDRIIISLKHVLEVRDAELRNAQVELNKLKKEREEYQPKMDEAQRSLSDEKAKLSKLFVLAQELDGNLSAAKQDLLARDAWFRANVEPLRDIQRVLETYDRMMAETRTRRDNQTKARDDIRGLAPKPSDRRFEPRPTPAAPAAEITVQKQQQMPPAPSAEVKATGGAQPNAAGVLQGGSGAASIPEGPMDKEAFVEMLTNVPGLGRTKAESIYNAGYTDLGKLRQATPKQLSEVNGVSIELARKVKLKFR